MDNQAMGACEEGLITKIYNFTLYNIYLLEDLSKKYIISHYIPYRGLLKKIYNFTLYTL